MSKDKDEDFSLIDLDHDIVKSAVIKTIDRELTDEEIEDLALSQMETDEGFILEEKRMAQGLSNFPFEGSDVFVPLDEDRNEITHNLKDLLRIASRLVCAQGIWLLRYKPSVTAPKQARSYQRPFS